MLLFQHIIDRKTDGQLLGTSGLSFGSWACAVHLQPFSVLDWPHFKGSMATWDCLLLVGQLSSGVNYQLSGPRSLWRANKICGQSLTEDVGLENRFFSPLKSFCWGFSKFQLASHLQPSAKVAKATLLSFVDSYVLVVIWFLALFNILFHMLETHFLKC